MFSRCLSSLLCLALLASCQARVSADAVRELRVCADPNNLPFTNQRLEGFENRIAAIVAADLGASVHYTWWAQRRGFFRNTLAAGKCDVVMGVPASFEMALPTRPYYRSSYVFVSRKDRNLNVRSFDDPALRSLIIGVQLVGDDSSNTPPAHALSRRGITHNVRGYTLYGDYADNSPPARIIDAVAKGEIDIAVVWGPLAGFFATKNDVPLNVVPVASSAMDMAIPNVFDIAIGVRKGDQRLRDRIQTILDRRQTAIGKILDDYGIPRV
jgi:mxaJ protein